MKNTFKKLLLCFLAVVAVITGSAAGEKAWAMPKTAASRTKT